MQLIFKLHLPSILFFNQKETIMANYILSIKNEQLNQTMQYLYQSDTGTLTAQRLYDNGEEIIIRSRLNTPVKATFQRGHNLILSFILKSRCNLSIDDFATKSSYAKRFKLDENTLSQALTKISKIFKDIEHEKLIRFNTFLTKEFLFNHTANNAREGRMSFQHQYEIITTSKSASSVYEENQKSEASVKNTDLISVLLDKSEILPELLYKTTAGDHLPFILITQSVKFPLSIDNESISVKHEWKDSYKKQKEALGARMYDGKNLRALSIKENTLTVGQSSYFAVLDSADYIASRLKVYYHQKNDVEFERIFNEWSSRLQDLKEHHRFDSYNSGMAFSMPVFQICKDGSLNVFAPRNSNAKGTGSGKRHVSPAGMLEIFSLYKGNSLSFDEFKTICAKELLEETVFGGKSLILEENNKFVHILAPFFDNTNLPQQDGITFVALKNYIETINEHWQEIWESLNKTENQPNNAALIQVLNMSESDFYRNSFIAVDFANLRPEFIVPIYIKDPINKIVNWEYDAMNLDACIVSFNNLTDLNHWAKEEVNDFCAPALAAIYLGAKQFFEGKVNP